MERCIQFYINTWLSDGSELFDFNTKKQNEQNMFKAKVYKLPIPKHDDSKHFYFVHQSISRESKGDLLIERSMKNISKLQKSWSGKYKLLCGFKIFTKIEKNKKKVYLKPINAADVQFDRKGKEKFEERKPFLILKTFLHGFPIKEGQIIKMGKTEMEIIQKAINFQIKKEDILDITRKETYSEEGNQPRICKICYETEGIDQLCLVAPCRCKGTAKYIHIVCLKNWLVTKLSKFKNGQNQGKVYHTNELFCEICRQPYPKKIITNGNQYSLLPFAEENQPFVGLKILGETNQLLQYDPNIGSVYITVPKGEKVMIGRNDSSQILIPDNSVSRRHASIQHYENDFRIFDSGSKFGTLIYQKDVEVPLHKSHMVGVEIGSTVFSFKIIKQ